MKLIAARGVRWIATRIVTRIVAPIATRIAARIVPRIAARIVKWIAARILTRIAGFLVVVDEVLNGAGGDGWALGQGPETWMRLGWNSDWDSNGTQMCLGRDSDTTRT